MSEPTPTPEVPEVVIEQPTKKIRNVERRLTVTSTLYIQTPGVDPIEFPEGYSHFIEEDEQPFDRMMRVKRQWIRLELGWMRELKHCTMSFVNKSPESGPNLEIRLEEFNTNRIIVAPGKSARFAVDDPKELWIRSSHDEDQVKIRYIIVPE